MYCTFQQVRFTVDPPKERARPFFFSPRKGKRDEDCRYFVSSSVTFWTLCSILLVNEVRVVASVASPASDASELFFSYFSIGLRGVGNRPLK